MKYQFLDILAASYFFYLSFLHPVDAFKANRHYLHVQLLDHLLLAYPKNP